MQYDDEGNAYDYDGNFVSYAEGYTPEDEYTSEDEYGFEDEYSGEEEYEEEYEEDAKGGLIGMAEGGLMDEPIDEKQNADGTITQMFDDGSSITYTQDGEVMKVSEAKKFDDGGGAYSDTDEEVQDFQNVGYNFGESDDPTMFGYTLTGNRNPVGNTYSSEGRGTGLDFEPEEEGRGTGLDFTPDNPNRLDSVANDAPSEWNDNGDGTFSRWEGNQYVTVDGETSTELSRTDSDGNLITGGTDGQNNQPVTTTGGLGQANQGIEYFDDGSYRETYEDGSSVIYDPNGKIFSSTDNEGNTEIAKTTTVDDDGNRLITDYYGNVVQVLDPQGNVIPMGGGRVTGPTQVTGAGDEGAVDITKNPTAQQRREEQELDKGTQSAIDSLLAGLNTYGGAGAAGAVLGALLSDTDLFGGGTGSSGGNFDMTGVGAIDPRTTDFGIGPANYVGYDEYGTPEQMPELYGNELYQNLNAPGFNEVNAGDYARMDAEEFGEPVSEDIVEEEGMAAGGQPQGGLGQTYPQTYYTFGKPVDPLENLRNPMPFQKPQEQQQGQQQGQPQMPPQAAQNAQQAPQAMPPMGMPQTMAQGMPQGMPTQMRRGGLPHASNVPMTQGRMDFRRGAAVHGAGDGQSDDIPAMLADGEYVIDAETVAQIGNGSTKAGAQALDKFRENIRMHKRSAPINKIPPKTKALTSYLKGAR